MAPTESIQPTLFGTPGEVASPLPLDTTDCADCPIETAQEIWADQDPLF